MRLAGLSLLVSTNGESLKRGSVSLSGLVNRQVTKPKDGISARDGKLDFSVMGVTEIEFPFSMLNTVTVGDSFIDSVGYRHRVEKIMSTDISWVLYCVQSQV